MHTVHPPGTANRAVLLPAVVVEVLSEQLLGLPLDLLSSARWGSPRFMPGIQLDSRGLSETARGFRTGEILVCETLQVST